MNQAGNIRYQETEERLKKALRDSMKQKPLKDITVRELCDAARINKATFYRHYRDIYELAGQMEKDIHSGLIRLLDVKKERPLTELIGEDELSAVIGYIGEHAVFYREYLKTGHDTFLDERFGHLWKNFFMPQFRLLGVTSERRMQYYYRFFQSGMVTTILYWLETGMQESPRELASILWNMSYYQLPKENGGRSLA